MQAALALRGDARTFLTHFAGGGLEDDRYVVEKFRSVADGGIVVHGAGTIDVSHLASPQFSR